MGREWGEEGQRHTRLRLIWLGIASRREKTNEKEKRVLLQRKNRIGGISVKKNCQGDRNNGKHDNAYDRRRDSNLGSSMSQAQCQT